MLQHAVFSCVSRQVATQHNKVNAQFQQMLKEQGGGGRGGAECIILLLKIKTHCFILCAYNM